MAAYWIAHVDVTDSDVYADYARLATLAIESHGGKFLARGGDYAVLEGTCRPRNVLVEFPSMEDARRCYNSDAYQEALSYSGRSSDRDVILLEGI